MRRPLSLSVPLLTLTGLTHFNGENLIDSHENPKPYQKLLSLFEYELIALIFLAQCITTPARAHTQHYLLIFYIKLIIISKIQPSSLFLYFRVNMSQDIHKETFYLTVLFTRFNSRRQTH